MLVTVKLLKNERCNNSEVCNKWDLLIQTVRHEKIRPSAVANTEQEYAPVWDRA